MENFIQILQQQLLPEDIAILQSVGKLENIKTHKCLVDYGERCNHIYFVLRGGFVLKLLLEDGNERAINFYLDDFQPFMTVPQSYFRDIPSNCKLQAVKNSDVLAFAKHDLLQIIAQHEGIRNFYYYRVIEAFLGETDFRMKLIAYQPQQLYKILIRDYQEIIQNIPSKDIANFMGISPEWLSNLKQKI